MMVEDGTLKPAPSDDELHPASVPEAGPTAALSSTDQPVAVTAGTAESPRRRHRQRDVVGRCGVSGPVDRGCAGRSPLTGGGRAVARSASTGLLRRARVECRVRRHPDRRSGRAGRPGRPDARPAARPDRPRASSRPVHGPTWTPRPGRALPPPGRTSVRRRRAPGCRSTLPVVVLGDGYRTVTDPADAGNRHGRPALSRGVLDVGTVLSHRCARRRTRRSCTWCRSTGSGGSTIRRRNCC